MITAKNYPEHMRQLMDLVAAILRRIKAGEQNEASDEYYGHNRRS